MNRFLVKKLYSWLIVGLLFSSSAVLATTLPNITLKDTNGHKHSLHEYTANGKWNVVVVWGPKCPACIEEMPAIEMMYSNMDKSRFSVLGLALDYPSFGYAKVKQVKAFVDDNMLDFPNLLISSQIFDQLGLGRLQGTPTIIIANPQGKVVAIQAGAIPRKDIEAFLKKQAK